MIIPPHFNVAIIFKSPHSILEKHAESNGTPAISAPGKRQEDQERAQSQKPVTRWAGCWITLQEARRHIFTAAQTWELSGEPPDTGWPPPFLTNDSSSNRDSHELNLVSAVNSTSQFVQTESKLTILKSSQDSCTLTAGSGNRGSLSKLARLTKLASSGHQWETLPQYMRWRVIEELQSQFQASTGTHTHTCAHTSTNKHT